MSTRAVGAAVLAAGASRGLRSPKQLALLSGRPLLEPAETAGSMPELDPVVVILGARAIEIKAATRLGRARVVVCEAWSEGIAASVRLQCELSDCNAIVTLHGDQPATSEAAVRAVLAPPITPRAVYREVPGHPVACARST